MSDHIFFSYVTTIFQNLKAEKCGHATQKISSHRPYIWLT